ncbi:hypothetical protein HZA99_04345 [Candidatus Woesearchaeota archaeon]|nr:hypothetical protein [Candidatus Woesearchaeota archaeon]
MKHKLKVSAHEKKKYVLSTDSDILILRMCKILEKEKLTENDKVLVNLIKAQLEEDWRKSLLTALKKLLKKYKI